jgi:hypothetical protein
MPLSHKIRMGQSPQYSIKKKDLGKEEKKTGRVGFGSSMKKFGDPNSASL